MMAWRLGGTVAALLFVVSVQAQDSGPYLGASYGRSKAKLDTAPLDAQTLGNSTPVTAAEDHHNGGKLFLGYRINQNFAVEGGYADLGRFKATANSVTQFVHVIGPFSTPVTIVTPENFTITSKGVFLSALGGIAFLQRGLAYAKLGVYDMKVEVTSDVNCGINCPSGQPLSHSNVGPLFGAGLQYVRPSNVGIRAEWERFNKVGGSNTGKHDFDLFSVGLTFSF